METWTCLPSMFLGLRSYGSQAFYRTHLAESDWPLGATESMKNEKCIESRSSHPQTSIEYSLFYDFCNSSQLIGQATYWHKSVTLLALRILTNFNYQMVRDMTLHMLYITITFEISMENAAKSTTRHKKASC